MSQADKRREYRCGKQYNTLENVPAWPEVYEQNKDRLQKIAKKPLNKPNETYEVNPEINKKVTIWRGDITTLEIDAIVNAANNSLLGGGGVDGAIHSAAGSSLKAECAPLKGCETGDAKITGGYKLPSKYVIHTVGPIGSSEAKLRSCYEKCLKIVKDDKLRSVAFPCISTGIYGYPNNQAAPVALETARTFLEKNHEHVDRIIFCLFLKVDVALYEEMMQWYFPIGNGYKSSDDINTAEQKDVAGDVEAAATPEVTESTESKEEVKRIKVEGGDAKDEEHGEDMSKMVSCDAVKEETDSRPDKETPSENTKSETNSVEVAESESKTVEVTESESKTVEVTESESKAVEGTESKSKTVEDTESISTTVEATQFGPTIEEADEKSVKCTETKL